MKIKLKVLVERGRKADDKRPRRIASPGDKKTSKRGSNPVKTERGGGKVGKKKAGTVAGTRTGHPPYGGKKIMQGETLKSEGENQKDRDKRNGASEGLQSGGGNHLAIYQLRNKRGAEVHRTPKPVCGKKNDRGGNGQLAL